MDSWLSVGYKWCNPGLGGPWKAHLVEWDIPLTLSMNGWRKQPCHIVGAPMQVLIASFFWY